MCVTRLAEACLLRKHKGLADFAKRNALGSFSQRCCEAFNRLAQWLEAEPKRLMMNRHDEAHACVVCHFNCLLGRAMRPNPRVVSADGHDREIDRSVSPQFGEAFCHCSISGENDPPSISLEQITIVAAIVVTPLARAPMFHRNRGDLGYFGRSIN